MAVSLAWWAMAPSGASPVARAAGATVSIVDFAFVPSTVTITAGDTVTWTVTRAADPHTVTPVDPPSGFVGSDLLRQGDVFTVTFANPGTYRYECSIHPEEMKGSVTVAAAASSASGLFPTPGPSTAGSSSPAGITPEPASPAPSVTPGPLPESGGPFSGPAVRLAAALLALISAAAVAAIVLAQRRGSG